MIIDHPSYSVGVVGFGRMGKIRAQATDASGRGTIVKVYDLDETTDFLGYQVAPSPEAIIEDPTIDVVFIGTPNFLNKPLTIAALNHGKHVFCEKPPAFTSHDVKHIQRVERASGKILMYGFNHRHHSSVQRMKQLMDSGEFGDLLWMRGRYGKSVDEGFYDNWRSKKNLAGGGILLDQGIHMLDLFLFFAGEFDHVHAFVQNRYWTTDIEDNVFAILKNTRSEVVASLHSTMTQWRHLFSLEVFLSKGYMVLNGLNTSSGTYGEEVLSIAKNRSTAPAATWEDEERTTYDENKSWGNEIDHFFDAIDRDAPVLIGNSDDAMNVMRTIEAIYESDASFER
jgi:predicted dehydrogenase